MSNADPFRVKAQPIASKNLAGKYKQAWTEESLDIENAASERLGIFHTKKYLGTSVTGRRIILFGAVIISGFLIIGGRTFYLQAVRGAAYRALAEGNRLRLAPIAAERGIIYDRFGKELTQNIPEFTLTLVPQDLPKNPGERQGVLERIAALSGVTPDSLAALLRKYGSYGYASLVIKENLDYDTALRLYIANATLPGLAIESGARRRYGVIGPGAATSTLSLSHILGYLGKLNDEQLLSLQSQGYLPSDFAGAAGIEKTYETPLRGINGQEKIEVNALGKAQNTVAVTPPTPGKNLFLTIDLEAQNQLETAVKTMAKKINKRKITAIALNPQNGEILALVSWPAFDNNDFSGGISATSFKKYQSDPDNPLFNRAVSGVYPPGSTVKLIVASAALQEKVITKATSFNSVGGINVGGTLFKDWKVGGHGITDVIKALAWSVNTFFYDVGGGYQNFVGLGVDRLTKYMSLFNLGKKTGVDLPAENPGFVPSKEWKKQNLGEDWFVGDTYNLSIGQGYLLVSPLQDAIWTATVANGGTIVTPHLGLKLVDPVTNAVTLIPKKIISSNFISAANLDIVRQGMRACVLVGSCQLLKSLPFTSGGKTGTAQWSHTSPTHAWFTSFAPYDHPQIVVTVLVEDGGEGSTNAMPIARDFLSWWGKKYLAPHGVQGTLNP